RVLIEALVLRHYERIPHDRRNLLDGNEGASLDPELGDESPVSGIYLGCLPRLVALEDLHRWACSATANQRPCAVCRSQAEREQEHACEKHTADESRMALDEAAERRSLASHGSEPVSGATGVVTRCAKG